MFGQTTNQALFSSVYLSLSLSPFLSALACLARLREGISFPAQGVFVVSDLVIMAGVWGQSEAHAQTPLHEQCKQSTRAEALMPDNALLMQAAGSQGMQIFSGLSWPSHVMLDASQRANTRTLSNKPAIAQLVEHLIVDRCSY